MEQEEKPKPIKTEADFLQRYPFVRQKLKGGKLHCDRCGTGFVAMLPFYVVVIEVNEETICYPCNYKRAGINPYTKVERKMIKKEEIKKTEQVVKAPKKKKEKEKNNDSELTLF